MLFIQILYNKQNNKKKSERELKYLSISVCTQFFLDIPMAKLLQRICAYFYLKTLNRVYTYNNYSLYAYFGKEQCDKNKNIIMKNILLLLAGDSIGLSVESID